MAKNAFSEPSTKTKINGVSATFGDTKFSIKDDSKWFDEKTQTTKDSPRGCRIRTIGMKSPIMISATALVGIYHLINDNSDVREDLKVLMAEEVARVQSL